MNPTHTASEVLESFIAELNDILLDGDDSDVAFLTPKAYDKALSTLEADLLAIIGLNLELESTYDYDYKITQATVNAHNKTIQAVNDRLDDVRSALYKYMGRPAVALDTPSVPSQGSGASDE